MQPWKVNVGLTVTVAGLAERSVRRGEGDRDLAEALQRDAEGKWESSASLCLMPSSLDKHLSMCADIVMFICANVVLTSREE